MSTSDDRPHIDEHSDNQQAFYDQADVFETYAKHRARPDNPNDVLERPVFLDLLGDVNNLDILDLGCGDGAFGIDAFNLGARSYTGLDASTKMIRQARVTLAEHNATLQQIDVATWQPRPSSVDVVTSRLALNYLPDVATIFQHMFTVLRPKGRLVISVEHPLITCNFTPLANGPRTTWQVDTYFVEGPREHTWLGQPLNKYHHTLESWLNYVQQAGFNLHTLRESRPRADNFHDTNEYQRRLRIPLFLFIAACK
ncbi:MAG: class I SAM-dependent methyltransferase [Deinococcota bacterium]